MKDVTLDKWMIHMWLPPVPGAEKYRISQELSNTQAKEIMHMIARSAEFDMASIMERRGPLYHGYPYRDFISGYMALMLESGVDDRNGWRKKLWRVLPDMDKKVLQKYARQIYNFDIKELGCVR